MNEASVVKFSIPMVVPRFFFNALVHEPKIIARYNPEIIALP